MRDNRRIVYKETDGKVFIICPTPSWNGTLEELVKINVKKEYEYAILESNQIPKDSLFMASWVFNKNSNPVVSVDIDKAKLIWKDKWREARLPILQQLDIEYMKALESQDTEWQHDVAAKKEALRNVTMLEIPGNTTQEIRAFWPEILGPNPYAFR